jgi:hypothetical protein
VPRQRIVTPRRRFLLSSEHLALSLSSTPSSLCFSAFIMESLEIPLDEIVSDPFLCSIFRSFLEKNFMSVSFDCWLDILRFEEAKEDSKRWEIYDEIFRKYLVEGCPSPMSFSSRVSRSLSRYKESHAHFSSEESSEEPSLPRDLFKRAKDELWVILQWTSIPAFVKSTVFQDILDGKSGDAQSRLKCESFFGQKISGPLQRSELVEILHSASRESKATKTRRSKG